MIARNASRSGRLTWVLPEGWLGKSEQMSSLIFRSKSGDAEIELLKESLLLRPRSVLILEPPPPDAWMIREGLRREFDVEGRLVISWRTEPFENDLVCAMKALLHIPYRYGQPAVLFENGPCAGSEIVNLPQDLLPGDGFMVELVTSSGHRSRSTEFRLSGARVIIRSPNRFNEPFTIGDRVHVQWESKGIPTTVKSMDFVLESMNEKTSRVCLSVDLYRRKATFNLGKQMRLKSGYYRMVARTTVEHIELGESSELYIQSYEAFLLSPFSAAIYEPVDSIQKFSAKIPIRWAYVNPQHMVRAVSIKVRAFNDASLAKTVQKDIEIKQTSGSTPRLATWEWRIPAGRDAAKKFLNIPLQMEIVPHPQDPSDDLIRKELFRKTVSCPFIILPRHETSDFERDEIRFRAFTLEYVQLGGRMLIPEVENPKSSFKHYTLKLVEPDWTSFPKKSIVLDGRAGGEVSLPINFVGNRKVFIKAVDSNKPARVLGLIGPFWLRDPFVEVVWPSSTQRKSFNAGGTARFQWISGQDRKFTPSIIARRMDGAQGDFEVSCDVNEGRWEIPFDISEGELALFDGSSHFEKQIRNFYVVPALNGVTTPLHRDTWRPGEVVLVSWITDLSMPQELEDQYRIFLRDEKDSFSLGSTPKRAGRAFVKVPKTILPGKNWHVVLESPTSRQPVISEVFKIFDVPVKTFLPNDELVGAAASGVAYLKSLEDHQIVGIVDDDFPVEEKQTKAIHEHGSNSLSLKSVRALPFAAGSTIFIVTVSSLVAISYFGREIQFVLGSSTRRKHREETKIKKTS